MMCHREETITNDDRGGGWCDAVDEGGGGWSGQISKENQKRKEGNTLIFSFDLPVHAKRDLQFKRARRKL